MSGITHLNDDDALLLVSAIYKQALDDIAGRDYATPYQMRQAHKFIRDNPYNLPDAVMNEIEKEARKYAN